MTTLYFAGTENSLFVAKRIGGKLLSISHVKYRILDMRATINIEISAVLLLMI